ncbi:hypothetical protein DKM44_03840 [Deinococcus irradiatisoli]|uniref:Uncharacterized protein n=1 Tax=Deinococcus irradiatisoli TaxID=2202254 RepID=A0A2Z3JMM9_9DEIO|nr:hypothetical protein [Deinococcus irradiatisoli]AWN22474.1 hypothetical protein DKM44_03840 [Deinococcus irradiatisoli]
MLLVDGKFTPRLGQMGVYNVALEVPAAQKGQTVTAEVQLYQAKGHAITMTVLEATAAATIEIPNTPGLIYPDGWTAPFKVGPVYKIKLKGWHVPPFRILFPWGLIQYAAGAVVTWNKNEASTEITTAAWPYPGQKRGRA